MLKLKQPEEMECGLDIGYQICMTQSKLFAYAIEQNYDDADFIKKYMNSDFCNKKMDALWSRFQLMNAAYNMSYLLDEINPAKNDMHYDPETISWIGWMYRYAQLRLEIPSRNIYKMLPLSDMLVYYKMTRTEDAEYFIEQIQTKFEE